MQEGDEGDGLTFNRPNPDTCASLCEEDPFCAAAFFDQVNSSVREDQTGQCYLFSLRGATFVGTTSDDSCKQEIDVCYYKTGKANQRICTGADVQCSARLECSNKICLVRVCARALL